jgi:hypothetical protein
VSLAGLGLTMLLAWQNELSMPVPPGIGEIRGMVSIHGAINALVVAPCFRLAVELDARRTG